jgi:hypothetical protein
MATRRKKIDTLDVGRYAPAAALETVEASARIDRGGSFTIQAPIEVFAQVAAAAGRRVIGGDWVVVGNVVQGIHILPSEKRPEALEPAYALTVTQPAGQTKRLKLVFPETFPVNKISVPVVPLLLHIREFEIASDPLPLFFRLRNDEERSLVLDEHGAVIPQAVRRKPSVAGRLRLEMGERFWVAGRGSAPSPERAADQLPSGPAGEDEGPLSVATAAPDSAADPDVDSAVDSAADSGPEKGAAGAESSGVDLSDVRAPLGFDDPDFDPNQPVTLSDLADRLKMPLRLLAALFLSSPDMFPAPLGRTARGRPYWSEYEITAFIERWWRRDAVCTLQDVAEALDCTEEEARARLTARDAPQPVFRFPVGFRWNLGEIQSWLDGQPATSEPVSNAVLAGQDGWREVETISEDFVALPLYAALHDQTSLEMKVMILAHPHRHEGLEVRFVAGRLFERPAAEDIDPELVFWRIPTE